MSTNKTLTTKNGKGKALADLLIKELGIPPRCTWFEVRFALDEAVTVKTEFYAEENINETGETK